MFIPFVAIENDNQAEDLITQIQQVKEEMGRLVDVCNYEIDKYQDKIQALRLNAEKETADAITMLGEYCRNKANHATKTLISYKLPSGKLQWTKKAPKVIRDESALLIWTEKNFPACVKTEKKTDWAGLKEALKIVDNHYEYSTPDGELIPVDGVTLEEQPETFEIK